MVPPVFGVLRVARVILTRSGGFWRWRRSMMEAPIRGGRDRRGRASNGARLGAAAEPGRSDRPRHRQGARQAALLDDAQRERLRQVVDDGPIPAIHGVVRWRLIDLMAWVFEEFRLSISKQTMSRELRAMGFRKLSARPRHHAKSEAAADAVTKRSRPAWTRSPRPRPAASR